MDSCDYLIFDEVGVTVIVVWVVYFGAQKFWAEFRPNFMNEKSSINYTFLRVDSIHTYPWIFFGRIFHLSEMKSQRDPNFIQNLRHDWMLPEFYLNFCPNFRCPKKWRHRIPGPLPHALMLTALVGEYSTTRIYRIKFPVSILQNNRSSLVYIGFWIYRINFSVCRDPMYPSSIVYLSEVDKESVIYPSV